MELVRGAEEESEVDGEDEEEVEQSPEVPVVGEPGQTLG